MLNNFLSKFGFGNEKKSITNTEPSILPNNSSSIEQKVASTGSRIVESAKAIASGVKSGLKSSYNATTTCAAHIYDTTCKTVKKAGNVLLNYTLDPIAKKEVFPAIGKSTDKEIKIKESLKALGAEQKKVSVGNDCEIDTMLISAKNFEQKMSEAGGEKVKLSLGENEVVDGFKIPKSKFGAMQTNLFNAKFFHDAGLGYIQATKNSKFIYLTSGDFARKYGSSRDSNKATKLEESENKLPSSDSNTIQKTAILCNGIKGRYANEYILREAAVFLLQGIDVQLFDYPEHGESTGSASHQNNYEALHSVCEAVKKNNQDNKDLILRGTCYGASLAARYAGSKDGKGSNLILHDTYHESTELSRIYTFNKGIFANSVKDHYFEEHSLENDLKNVEGNVLVFSNLSDEYIFDHALQDKNLDALTNGKKGRRFSCLLAGGSHAHEWYREVNSAEYEKENLKREFFELILDSATEEEKKNSRIWMHKLKTLFSDKTSLRVLKGSVSAHSVLSTLKGIPYTATTEEIRICEIIFQNIKNNKINEFFNREQNIGHRSSYDISYGLDSFKNFVNTIK